MCCCYYYSKDDGGRYCPCLQRPHCLVGKSIYMHTVSKLAAPYDTAEHEPTVQCQNATTLQSDRLYNDPGPQWERDTAQFMYSANIYQVPTRARPCARCRRCNNQTGITSAPRGLPPGRGDKTGTNHYCSSVVLRRQSTLCHKNVYQGTELSLKV